RVLAGRERGRCCVGQFPPRLRYLLAAERWGPGEGGTPPASRLAGGCRLPTVEHPALTNGAGEREKDEREYHPMHALMNVLRRTWLATTLLVIVSTTFWWQWLDWESAREYLLPTLFLSPVIWWATIGKRRPPPLRRGLVAGALTCLVTQMAPSAPYIWQWLAHRGGDGRRYGPSGRNRSHRLLFDDLRRGACGGCPSWFGRDRY